MPTYKVKTRFFKQGKTVYKKGDLVETDKNLFKAFPNKFDIVHDDLPVKKAKKPKVRVIDDEEEEEEEVPVRKTKKKKIKAGA